MPKIYSHIVPVSPPHLQGPLAANRCISDITIASNVLKGMASSPLTWPCPAVPLQLVWFGETVPRPQDLHREDSSRRLAVCSSVLACSNTWHGESLQHKSDECSRGHHTGMRYDEGGDMNI